MANSFAQKVEVFSTLLDEKFQDLANTSILEVSAKFVGLKGTKKIQFPKIDMSPLSNYSRTAGFQAGNVKISFEEHELIIDRGIQFTIDVLDDDEVAFTAFANLSEQFMRTKTVPEIDAFRFNKFVDFAISVNDDTIAVIGTGTADAPQNPGTELYDQLTLAPNIVEADIGTDNVLDAYDDMAEYYSDEEIEMSSCVTFVSNKFFKALKQADNVTRFFMTSDAVTNSNKPLNRKITTLDEMPLIKVPISRFKTALTLTTGDVEFNSRGYTFGGGSKDINFLSIHREAVYCVLKHQALRYFAPATFQNLDSHVVQYRLHHDVISPERKRKGIYVHTEA